MGYRMTAEIHLKARIVRVRREQGATGLFYATSPDLRGLLVAEPTLDGLEKAIPEAIRDLYMASGEPVLVTRTDHDTEEFRSWVAFPVEIATDALERMSQ